MSTIEGVTVWTLLAFALWLVMTLVFSRLRLKGAAIAAAVLSWLVARVAMSFLPLLLEWLQSHLRA